MAQSGDDPLGHLTKYTYDANGNVTTIEKQASVTPTWQTTNFTYTRLNHVATVTDPLSRVTTRVAQINFWKI